MYDFLIIGQGLAGSILGYYLHKKNLKFFVINKESSSSPSKVASGVYNPISLRRLSLIWKVEEQLCELNKFIKNFEKDFNVSIYQDIKVHRRFSDIYEQNKWLEFSSKPLFKDFLGEIEELFEDNIDTPFNIAPVNESGRLLVSKLLSTFKKKIKNQQIILNKKFDFDKLVITRSKVFYENITARNIVFCEGPLVIHNPFFNYLPFALTKGELLEIKSELNLDKIINSHIFILPKGNNKYIIGSTYNWSQKDYLPTEKAKNELIERFIKISNCKFEIIKHKASIRPTTIDRRPMIGWHHKYKNVAIFNGLGSKGVIMAPYLAKMFCDNYLENSFLDNEANITRF